MFFRRLSVLFLIALLFLFSCAGPPPVFLKHPQVKEKVQAIHTVVLIPPQIDVYELSTGGVKERIDEWSEETRQYLIQAFTEQFGSKPNVQFVVLNTDSLNEEQKALLKEVLALYKAVHSSIVYHLYGQAPDRLSGKMKNFDYSLGPGLNQLSPQADAFLFVKGLDFVPSSGRKTLQTTAIVVGLALGVMVIPRGEFTAISTSLVDAQSGEILWHKYISTEGGIHVRNESGARKFVKSILKFFPIK